MLNDTGWYQSEPPADAGGWGAGGGCAAIQCAGGDGTALTCAQCAAELPGLYCGRQGASSGCTFDRTAVAGCGSDSTTFFAGCPPVLPFADGDCTANLGAAALCLDGGCHRAECRRGRSTVEHLTARAWSWVDCPPGSAGCPELGLVCAEPPSTGPAAAILARYTTSVQLAEGAVATPATRDALGAAAAEGLAELLVAEGLSAYVDVASGTVGADGAVTVALRIEPRGGFTLETVGLAARADGRAIPFRAPGDEAATMVWVEPVAADEGLSSIAVLGVVAALLAALLCALLAAPGLQRWRRRRRQQQVELPPAAVAALAAVPYAAPPRSTVMLGLGYVVQDEVEL